jgi:hypothetical protein
VIWFAEAYRWESGTSWLGILNPQASPQTVTVTVLGASPVERRVLVPARSRSVVELGEWGVRGDFGVEVLCEGVCVASLVMWDAGFKQAHESGGMSGCRIE